MVRYIKVNGLKKVSGKDKVFNYGKMAVNMKDTGKMTKLMGMDG